MQPEETWPHGIRRLLAGLCDKSRQYGVSKKALGLVELACIDVGLAGVAGRIDQEFGLVALKRSAKEHGVRVVELGTAQAAKGDGPTFKKCLVRLPNIARAA